MRPSAESQVLNPAEPSAAEAIIPDCRGRCGVSFGMGVEDGDVALPIRREYNPERMSAIRILWDLPDDPDGNVQHIADHGLTIDDVEEVLADPDSEGTSHSSGLPCVWGYTVEGIYIIVVYDEIDRDTIRVVTVYEVPEPGQG